MKQFALILLIVTAFIAVVSRPVATNQLRGSEVEYATGLWDRELCLTRPQSNPRCPGWKPPICLSHPEMYICLPRRGSGLGRPARNFCDEETGRCTGSRPSNLCRDEPDNPGCLGRRNSANSGVDRTKTEVIIPDFCDKQTGHCTGLLPLNLCRDHPDHSMCKYRQNTTNSGVEKNKTEVIIPDPCDKQTRHCTGLLPLNLCRDHPDHSMCKYRQNMTNSGVEKNKTEVIIPDFCDREARTCTGLLPLNLCRDHPDHSMCKYRQNSTVPKNVGPESGDLPPLDPRKHKRVPQGEDEGDNRQIEKSDSHHISRPRSKLDGGSTTGSAMWKAWRKFKKFYNKVYESDEEEHDRRRAFFKNWRSSKGFDGGKPPQDADEE